MLVWNLEDHDGGALLQEGKPHDAAGAQGDAPQLQARLKLSVRRAPPPLQSPSPSQSPCLP